MLLNTHTQTHFTEIDSHRAAQNVISGKRSRVFVCHVNTPLEVRHMWSEMKRLQRNTVKNPADVSLHGL